MKKNMKWIISALALVLVIAGAGILYNRLAPEYQNGNDRGSQTQEKAPVSAPDFTVTDMEGNAVKLSDFKGKPVVINFWATWCGFCKQEMPDFDKAAKDYPDVQFMMINATDGYRETAEIAKNYISECGYEFDVFLDTQLEAVGKYYVTGFPATLFIDKDGNVAARANGAINYQTIQRTLDNIL